MILRDGGGELLVELHDDLAEKTVGLWNSKSGKAYDRYVPWMSCLPDPPHVIAEHPALSDRYIPGSLVTSTDHLSNINEYLCLPQASRLAADIFKNLPAKYANSRIAQEQVSANLLDTFASAKEAVLESHSLFPILFDRLVHAVVPFQMPETKMNVSLDFARGAIFMSFSEPLDEWEIAVDLAHELGHQALMILNSADPLFESDITTPVFSGVRLTERPAIQSLHAATALAFMMLFAYKKADPRAQEATATFVRQLHLTLVSIRAKCSMTELGRAVLDDYQQLCNEASDKRSLI